jgi:hypothetical protein
MQIREQKRVFDPFELVQRETRVYLPTSPLLPGRHHGYHHSPVCQGKKSQHYEHPFTEIQHWAEEKFC